jgi:hypothetical protein
VTVTDAVADFVRSAVAVAVTAIAAPGTLFGARYRPDVLIVPVAAVPPLTPFTFQITLVLELF